MAASTNRMRRAWLPPATLLAALVFAAAACGDGDAVSSRGGEVSRTSPEGTDSETRLTLGFLDAGEYRTGDFAPAFSFVVGDDEWRAEGDTPRFVTLSRPLLDSALEILRAPQPVGPGAAGQPIPLPDDQAAWLKEHPDLQIEAVTEEFVDGIAATRVDAVASSDTTLFASETGAYRIEEGANARLVVLEAKGEALVIAMTGPPEHWEEFSRFAERLVASINFR